MKIHVLGAAGNNIAYKVAEKLRKEPEHDIVHIKDPIELFYDDNIVVLDSCTHIDEVKVFTNANDMFLKNHCSLHGTDLKHFLNMTEGNKKVTIVGIPCKGELKTVTEDVRDSLQQLQGSYVQRLGRLRLENPHL